MHADAWFAIGDTHVVCEDFACAGVNAGGQGYAVVCDGCSSSPQTDVGARLLAAAARAELERGVLPGPAVIEPAASAARMLHLPAPCLDATLLVALADDEGCRVRVFGDGVVAARRRDGTLQVHRFEHPDGAPPYPSYGLDPRRQAQWQELCSPVLWEYVDGAQPARVAHHSPPQLSFGRDEFVAVALGSDGLDAFVQVQDQLASAVPTAAVVQRLLAFPQPRGRFLARRGRRFLRRECARAGWRPTDDISLAAILWPAEAA